MERFRAAGRLVKEEWHGHADHKDAYNPLEESWKHKEAREQERRRREAEPLSPGTPGSPGSPGETDSDDEGPLEGPEKPTLIKRLMSFGGLFGRKLEDPEAAAQVKAARRRQKQAEREAGMTGTGGGGDDDDHGYDSDDSDDSDESDYDGEGDDPLRCPATRRERILFSLTIPIMFAVHYTIPDCKRRKWKKQPHWTLLVALGWILVFVFFLTWFSSTICAALKFPDFTMGFTVVALGFCFPDGLSSVIMARNGFGDMAVGNSVGNSIFSLTVGLGLPWMLASLVRGPLAYVESNSAAMHQTFLFVGAAVVAVVLGLLVRRWRLGRPLGALFFLVYLGFLALAVLLQAKVLRLMGTRADNCRANWDLLDLKEQQAWDAEETAEGRPALFVEDPI